MKIKKTVLFGILLCLPFFDAEIHSKGFGEHSKKIEPISACDDVADTAMIRQDYKTGILLHERLLKKNGENGLAWYHLGYAYGQMGDHQREVRFYERAVALGFKDAYIFFNLGMAYRELGEIEKSIGTFKKAVTENPKDPDTYYGLGLGYYLLGKEELARAALLKSTGIDPEHLDARTLLSVLSAGQMKREKRTEKKGLNKGAA